MRRSSFAVYDCESERERERSPRYRGAIPGLDPPLRRMHAWMARIQSVDPPPVDSRSLSIRWLHSGLHILGAKLILAVM